MLILQENSSFDAILRECLALHKNRHVSQALSFIYLWLVLGISANFMMRFVAFRVICIFAL